MRHLPLVRRKLQPYKMGNKTSQAVTIYPWSGCQNRNVAIRRLRGEFGTTDQWVSGAKRALLAGFGDAEICAQEGGVSERRCRNRLARRAARRGRSELSSGCASVGGKAQNPPSRATKRSPGYATAGADMVLHRMAGDGGIRCSFLRKCRLAIAKN